MPGLIVAHTETLCNFLLPLLVGWSDAQQRHALNLIEALLVSQAKHKTLAALTRLLRVAHADEYALADFLRRSPWSGAALRTALVRFLLQTVCQLQTQWGWRLLFLSVDDALCRKDAATHVLQAVAWFFDHVTPKRQKGYCTKASCYVTVHLQLGPLHFTPAWRLYLRRAQVQALNRERRQQGLALIRYQSLHALVQEMLDELAPLLPSACRVYVLFDAWYDSHDFLKYIRARRWHFICATRSNRALSDRKLSQWWRHLGHQRIQPVRVRSTTRSHTYRTRHTTGRLRRYPDPVIAVLSKRDRRDRRPAYFLCSDVTLSVRTILKYYGYRWQAEVDNWFLKERLGLADYRVQSVEAITQWHSLVFAAYAFLQYQRVLPLQHPPQTRLPSLAEGLKAHQHQHTCQTVRYIAKLARQGWSDERLLAHLFPT